MNEKLKRFSKYFFSVIVVAIVVGFIVNYTTWFTTKEKCEVTFKLDGWITIESVKFSDLPSLNLMLDSQKVDNIMKVSWRIINTGNKGIDKFESKPIITIPENMKVYIAKISDKSANLKVCNNIVINKNTAIIDSLGVFNANEFMKIDFYLINVKEQEITNKAFENWQLICKSVDLKIEKDVLSEIETRAKKDKTELTKDSTLSIILYIASTLSLIFLTLSVYDIYRQYKQKKLAKLIEEDKKKDQLTKLNELQQNLQLESQGIIQQIRREKEKEK